MHSFNTVYKIDSIFSQIPEMPDKKSGKEDLANSWTYTTGYNEPGSIEALAIVKSCYTEGEKSDSWRSLQPRFSCIYEYITVWPKEVV